MQVLQSNKWTFSLASLVMLFAIGLVVVSPATAGVLGENFEVKFEVVDVVDGGGIEVEDDDTNGITVSVVLAKEITDAEAITAGKFSVVAYDHNGLLLDAATTLAVEVRDAGTTNATTAGSTAKMYDLNINGATAGAAATDAVEPGNTIVVSVAKGAFTNANQADVVSALHPDNSLGKNERAQLVFKVVDPDAGAPEVLAISMVTPATVSNFSPAGVRGPFSVQVLLSEKPKAFTAADHLEVTNGKVDSVVAGGPIVTIDTDGDGTDDFTAANSTGRGDAAATAPAAGSNAYDGRLKLQSYLVTITPDLKKNDDIVISVKDFEDMVLPIAGKYARGLVASLTEGQGKLTLTPDPAAVVADPDVFKPSADHLGANPHLKALPEKAVIPANGYLILARGKTDSDPVSGVVNVSAKPADKKTAASKLYNITYDFGLPFPANDLSNFFRNGGTLQLLHADIAGNTAGADGDKGYGGATTGAVASGAVIISEIMWGLDAGSINSQYIELHNTTAAAIGIDKNEWVISVGSAADTFYTTVVDAAGNNPATGFWEVPGSDGVTKVQLATGYPTLVDVVSMSRVTGGTDGTAAASWAASKRPSANLEGRRIGTPGAANVYVMPAAPPPTPAPPPAPATPVATAADIGITEVMVSTGNGRLPQWIELTNLSAGEVSLAGWSALIENAEDADVLGGGADITLDLSDAVLGVGEGEGNGDGEGQSLLLVAWSTRNSGNFNDDRVMNLASQLEQTGRYQLLSYNGFKITLMPPQSSAIVMHGDSVGNLGAGWDLPMSEEGRSSLIRMEMDTAGMATMGTSADGWRLASATDLVFGPTSWYGSDEDAGTPGYDAGGPLPVELSLFYPTRDKLTGQVVITWETQSELNNAGFFIKRSEAKNGKFMVINPTMIAGAGTTSEKQSYTYTDTTAKPNVVYYYQIEDVSLDGQRQTLTLGTRLRGHIGAAGKATTTWGELKAQE